MPRTIDLFDISKQTGKTHPTFIAVKNSWGHVGVRRLMNLVFEDMGDSDGNFRDQFQTAGFHARVFELCCFAALKTNGFEVKSLSAPDFLIAKGSSEVAVEVTTSNPREDPFEDISMRALTELSDREIEEKIGNELPIRFGSSLFSKLSKKYWELEQCKDKPLVLAIGPFHEAGSMTFTDAAIAQYLYGIRQSPAFTKRGKLVIQEHKIESHTQGVKKISSNFFGQPFTEHVSGVWFSNCYTVPKFLRMGVQFGGPFDCPHKDVIREGFCLNPDPNASRPLRFRYSLRDPGAPPEDWDQGGVLFLNPNARLPIRPSLFPTLQTVKYDGKNLIASVKGFHPIQSTTLINVPEGDDNQNR